MLNAQFRPLDQWPGERTRNPGRAAFNVTYERSLDLLESELAKLRAKDITIQIDSLTRDYLRNDGWPKSSFFNVRAARCGVIISFESSKGPISMPCDKFNDWKSNLRAIALSLEALRQVDRYGVTRGNEQYRGWAKLEAPGAKNGKMDRDAAIRFLASLQSSPSENLLRRAQESQIREICRMARIENHPDRGGSHETFVTIAEAERVLCG